MNKAIAQHRLIQAGLSPLGAYQALNGFNVTDPADRKRFAIIVLQWSWGEVNSGWKVEQGSAAFSGFRKPTDPESFSEAVIT